MGKYNTIYSSLDPTTLRSLFSSERWNGLSGEQKLDACQEVENRLAAERGTEPREVKCSEIEGCTYGYQYGDTIELNSRLLNDGIFQVTYKDFNGDIQTRTVSVDSPSWEVFDTVNHEDMHGYWEDLGIMPETYIQFDSDSNLYRIQGCEKSAFEAGERNTLAAIREVESALGIKDPDAQTYIEKHSESSFQESLDNAKLLYNDNDIENTLNTFITNNDLGISPTNPSPSYEAIDDLYYQQCMDNFVNSEHSVSEESANLTTAEAFETIADGSEVLNNISFSESSNYFSELGEDGAVIYTANEYSEASIEADGAELSESASYDSGALSAESSSSSYDTESSGENWGIE